MAKELIWPQVLFDGVGGVNGLVDFAARRTGGEEERRSVSSLA